MNITNLEYTDISVQLPPIDFFIDKIKKNESFHFLRVNHGILDPIHLGYENLSDFENSFVQEDFESIADKMIVGSDSDTTNYSIKRWHTNSAQLKEKTIVFLNVLKKYKNISQKILISVSLGVGLGTHYGTWNANHRYQIGRRNVWQIVDKYRNFDFYYSGILKHYTIKKEIFQLFEELNDKDFFVILLGPKYFELYESIFNIKNFHHIKIPAVGAIEHIDDYIEEIKNLATKQKNTIVIHSTGHILSVYLAYMLKDTNIFGIDVGRSFDLLVKDFRNKYSDIPNCWSTLKETGLHEHVNRLRNPPMANGIYKITEEFEEKLADYTGAKYAVTLDNMSNGLFLALYYEHQVMNRTEEVITIPARTYPSVPCEIIHAGLKVDFQPVPGNTLKGAYQLKGSNVWDSALRFTEGMYIPGSHMCISFTGPYKHFKLSKGGAILTDDYEAYCWFKRARYSGRREMSYHDDQLDMLGWNFYMMPELAARGLLLMSQFYYQDGTKKINEDLELPYPDLSKFEIYRR
jgi:hypothetical protein